VPGPSPEPAGPAPVLPVPEIRDYQRINAQVAQLLDRGHPRVVLAGVEGQRLLLSGLVGPWRATVEVEGSAGPELAAALDAPGLRVVCRGAAADGAGRGLRAGSVLILGPAGDATGYAMAGGVLVAAGEAGPRAGLSQSGGVLVLAGPVGRLAGERQSGGLLVALGDLGPNAGHGRRGGRLARPPLDPDDTKSLRVALGGLEPWLGTDPFGIGGGGDVPL
jgi:methylamine---glutamate N-methyltransferase subunit B